MKTRAAWLRTIGGKDPDRRSFQEKMREAVRAANGGRLICEGGNCKVDWYAVYPEHIAESVFEVHHRVPLSSDENPTLNTIADLQILCACCHRAAHRKLAAL